MTQLNLRMELGLASGGNVPRQWHLTISDDDASVRVLEVRLPLEAFALLLGTASIKAVGDVNLSGTVGKLYEHREELVPWDCYAHRHEKGHAQKVRAALARMEAGGWKGRDDDMSNGHNRVAVKGKPHQRVNFYRWVERTETKEAAK